MSVRTYHILVVDDDGTSRRVLGHRLRTLGYTNIDLAQNRVAAFRCIVGRHYDLTFLDNNIPDIAQAISGLRQPSSGVV